MQGTIYHVQVTKKIESLSNTSKNMLEIEEVDDELAYNIDVKVQKERIREIIKFQKSTYLSSSSFSSPVASGSSFSSSSKSSSLLELMKGGSTSLRRLFDMEHTSLATHFKDYSGSPITIHIPLWDSDRENVSDIWAAVKNFRPSEACGFDKLSGFNSDERFAEGKYDFSNKRTVKIKRRLIRTKSFRNMPGLGIWRLKGFRLRFRLRRLRIMICSKKF